MKVTAIDHFVLTVRDVEATCRFYERVLGIQVATFGDGRRALHFGRQKINLHQAGQEFAPHAQRPVPGSADFCLLSNRPLAEVIAHITARGVDIIEGPVRRTGAAGPLESIYLRDPDGNLIEVAWAANSRSQLVLMTDLILDRVLLYAGLVGVNLIMNLALIPFIVRRTSLGQLTRRQVLIAALVVAVFVSIIEGAFYTGR